MDENNIAGLKREAPANSNAKIFLLGDFDPQGERIIRDPYYVSVVNKPHKCSFLSFKAFVGSGNPHNVILINFRIQVLKVLKSATSNACVHAQLFYKKLQPTKFNKAFT